MQQPEGCEWGIYFDAVHIITVNYTRQEIRLFECGSSAEGKLPYDVRSTDAEGNTCYIEVKGRAGVGALN